MTSPVTIVTTEIMDKTTGLMDITRVISVLSWGEAPFNAPIILVCNNACGSFKTLVGVPELAMSLLHDTAACGQRDETLLCNCHHTGQMNQVS